MEQHVRSDHHGVERGKVSLRKRLAPYGLIGPGGLWLAIFFLIPMVAMLLLSLETPIPTQGFKDAGYRFTEPGCWTLRASRGTGSASVWLQIAA